MTDIETTIAILTEVRDEIINTINELDTSKYFDMYRAECLDYDLEQVEMELIELYEKN
tara:strand:+ start:989 stop:1162 length:174 start_codon:yes stop_codon:yes gene_type:complete